MWKFKSRMIAIEIVPIDLRSFSLGVGVMSLIAIFLHWLG